MKITSLSDVEEFEQIPAEQRWRGDNTYDLICQSAAKYAKRAAFKFKFTAELDEEPLVISYTELLARINQSANAFYAAGVDIGGTVSLILNNLPENHYTLWGGQAIGIAGPINPMLEPQALRDIMIGSETQALVVLGPSLDADIWEKTASILDQVPCLKVVFQVNLDGANNTVASQTAGGIPILDFKAALDEQPSNELLFKRKIDREDIGVYFHTGGTTGTPKIAQLSHRNQVHMASVKVDFLGLNEESTAFCGMPLFHVNAVFNNGLNMIASGGNVVYLTPNGYRTKGIYANFWKLVEKYQCTLFTSVPTVIVALLNIPKGDADVSSLNWVSCGGAPISPEIFRQFQETTGVNICEGYGMTEGTCSSSGNPQYGEKRLGSIGIRGPYQHMKCAILDEKNTYIRDCEVDEVGVILLKGPNVFPGYKQKSANEGLFIDGDWLISGDLAREDVDGYFWMTGRAKDLIIRGGHNIDPKTIENCLIDHPLVEMAAAVGQPDSYAGELPCAYVTLNKRISDQEKDRLIEELLTFAKTHISERAATPVNIDILDIMPVTAVGKTFKPELQMLAIGRVLGGEVKTIEPGSDISVMQDKKRGMVANVLIPASTEDRNDKICAIKNALNKYAISFDVVA